MDGGSGAHIGAPLRKRVNHCVGRDDPGAPNPITTNLSFHSVGADLCVGPRPRRSVGDGSINEINEFFYILGSNGFNGFNGFLHIL
jgi:hypothetical protein